MEDLVVPDMIIMTGCGGFLGGHHLREMLFQGAKVIVVVHDSKTASRIRERLLPQQQSRVSFTTWTNLQENQSKYKNISALYHYAGPNSSQCRDDLEGSIRFKRQTSKILAEIGMRNDSFVHLFSSVHAVMGEDGLDSSRLGPYHQVQADFYGYYENFLRKQFPDLRLHFTVLPNVLGLPLYQLVPAWNLVYCQFFKTAKKDGRIIVNNPVMRREFVTLGEHLKNQRSIEKKASYGTVTYKAESLYIFELANIVSEVVKLLFGTSVIVNSNDEKLRINGIQLNRNTKAIIKNLVKEYKLYYG